jgi:hypothetical protein
MPDPTQNPQTTDPYRKQKLSILESIQRNMLFDAALQSIGYIILGTAIGECPGYNKPEQYSKTEFNPDQDIDITRFKPHTRFLMSITGLPELMRDFAHVVRIIKAEFSDIMACAIHAKRQVVADTMRIHIAREGGGLSIALIWVEETTV